MALTAFESSRTQFKPISLMLNFLLPDYPGISRLRLALPIQSRLHYIGPQQQVVGGVPAQ
jgi:hypothetical protein